MEFTLDNINRWLDGYYKAFHAFQGPLDTVQKMRDYFTPDFEFWSFNKPEGSVPRPSSLEDLLKSMVHPGLHEQIIPLDFVVDLEKMAVAVFAQIQFTDKLSGKTWPAIYASAFMYFTHDEKLQFRISKIRYFLENRPSGNDAYKDLWQKYRDQELNKK
jgi:hypothetical protein